ncbi:CidA/LrgA family protein [Brachybacterium sp. GPGPB12]|uniref:CidA/LrgA family protein n=1 Tax=Brachybacterium sp. GPGPB12 TaxID=3023517 RepID=UPI00313434DB
MSRAALLPPVLLGLVVLLLAQMVGLAATALLDLPVPGVVLGIVLLVPLGILRPTRGVLRAAEPAATPLLAHLQPLFVPPGVGILLELDTLAENALPLALAVSGSFVLALVVSGRCSRRSLRRQDRRRGAAGGPDGAPPADDPDGAPPAGGPDGSGRSPRPGGAGPSAATGGASL